MSEVNMQVALRISIGLLAFALASACANSPPRAAPVQQAMSANKVGDSTGGQASDPLPASSDHPGDNAAFEIAMRKRGYKPTNFRGERVYCRNETLTGSNLASKVCLTAAQIEAQERAGKEILTGTHQAGCSGKPDCN
jgi:hypothetical protein